ncbi:protein FAM216A isoform 2-T2 [Menidia menidia]
MRKQVTFAETQTVHVLHHEMPLKRGTEIERSEMALNRTDNGLKMNSAQASRSKKHRSQYKVVHVPKAMTAAPFLQHTALTPAQREYLYTIAASYSSAHVRSLITQHYMNVLHRRIQASISPNRDGFLITSATSAENENKKPESKAKSENLFRSKHKAKMHTNGGSGKFLPPDVPHRKARLLNKLATKHKRKKQVITSQPVKRKTQGKFSVVVRSHGKEDGEGGRRGGRSGQYLE